MFLSENDLQILREVLDEYTKQASATAVVPPELENYVFSKRFERRMRALIWRQKKSYYRFIDTVGKRVAGYAITLLLCALITVFSVKALREPFINFVVQTYEKFTSIFVQKSDITPTDANIEFEIMLPQYIPEGYEVKKTNIDGNALMYTYTNTNGNKLTFMQNINNYWKTVIDTENICYKAVRINKYEGVCYTNKDLNCLVFGNEIYTFHISGCISKGELIKIAESIVIK